MLSLQTDLPVYSFKQNVANALVGLENTPVELVAGTLNVQAYNAGIPIGTMFERLEGSQSVRVNLRGKINKCIAGAALVCPCYVTVTNTGLQAVTNAAAVIGGIAIYPFNPAQGDIVSYIQFDGVHP